jgi:nitrogen-specific signal transduction histidine kinase/ActR/RegA family two-component response regulator
MYDDYEYCCAFVTDISDRKLMEAERERLESQLRQAQKMEAIGSLAGGIAHDFNNILFPIMTYTELVLRDMSDDSTVRDSLENVLVGAKRARDLVGQILAFSSQATADIEPVLLSDLVEEVLRLVRSSLPSTIDIVYDRPLFVGRILADPTQLHQIAMNLFSNAFHAMEETGGILTVSVKEVFLSEDFVGPRLVKGKYICLTVADTGIGMTKDIAERIFDPYFTTKEKGKGTGLGLAVVHGIVKALKGEITVESEPDEGTKFRIYLPKITAAMDAWVPEERPTVNGGNEHILVVDDEPSIVSALTKMLTYCGYHITGKTDSLDALETFEKNPEEFDMLLADITMPRLTGDKLSVYVRKLKPDFPVVLMTGFKSGSIMARVDAADIEHVILKPMGREKLVQTIQSALKKPDR